MPSFFDFQQGTESGSRPGQDTAPLLGRFRAVPASRLGKRNSVGDLLGRLRGNSFGYGAVFGAIIDDGRTGGEGGLRRAFKDLWLEPKQEAVRNIVDRWWWRWGVLVVLPAALVC